VFPPPSEAPTTLSAFQASVIVFEVPMMTNSMQD